MVHGGDYKKFPRISVHAPPPTTEKRNPDNHGTAKRQDRKKEQQKDEMTKNKGNLPPGIEPDVGVEPTTLRCPHKSLTLYRLS